MNSCADEIYAYLVARMGNRFDADDVFQSTFFKVRRFLPTFRGDSSPTTWVMRIAMNEASSFRRHTGRELPLLTPDDALPPSDSDEAAYDPVRDETERDVAAGMKHLQGDLRDVLYFYYYKEMPYERIAQLIGKPVGTVKSRLFRAKEELRTFMEAHRDHRTQ
ncbi:MAG TPA: RNA polymerase sigma factor [Clostridia bacterium]|nr:RNA polymerase sigma factor [Clostridia bacterium]